MRALAPRLPRLALTLLASIAGVAHAQELPKSGVEGFDLIYASSPTKQSALFSVSAHAGAAPLQLGAAVPAVPSRWAHRRRTLGALETAIAHAKRGVYLTPMGDAVGTGAIHMVDLRGGVGSVLVPTGNPAGYDLALARRLQYVFSAEDDGAGHTVLRGFSYATPGVLTPLVPAQLVLAGAPSAYVNRIGFDELAQELQVPTVSGVHVVALKKAAPQMSARQFLATAPFVPTTNPQSFDLQGTTTWIVGTSTFGTTTPPVPETAGAFAWDGSGALGASSFGAVPGVPGKSWVPAAGTEELAVVGDGTDAYAYYLLREPPPGTFFIKPSAIGVVRFLGGGAPSASTIAMTDEIGEPFANPAVSGTRVAFESSFGPPFSSSPPGGGEKISILYTPLDPLGAGSVNGTLGVPGPLGGRISTKGMDRPIWTHDGTRVLAATSHFPGAPNPGDAGLEVLRVPAGRPLDAFTSPHLVVENLPFPNQSILFPSVFDPRVPALGKPLAGLTFFGNAFHQGLASLTTLKHGEVGQLQVEPGGLTQSPAVPNFPAILPPTFADATGSLVPVPGNFGARRTAFNLRPSLGLDGVTMAAAIDDEVLVQRSGSNLKAALGLGPAHDTVRLPLPQQWVTTTEFLSL